jgi:hypothetical protein
VWRPAFRDYVADEVIQQLTSDRHWIRAEPRQALPIGELFPYAYELFALQKSVSTGGRETKQNEGRSPASPRGTAGIFFAGRFEGDAGAKLEAWHIPGADERVEEKAYAPPTMETSGKLLLRFLLGRAASKNTGERDLNIDCVVGWHKKALDQPSAAQRMVFAPVKLDAKQQRGTDAILFRRESDLAPVLLAFYRLSDDLRFARIVSVHALDGVGPTSVVRRSLLERSKDYFLGGGFSAFTQKKGASLLLTRGDEETTQIERLPGRGCSIEFLEERDLPEEPWKVVLDPRAPKHQIWGHAMAFAVGRNGRGDQRPPRDAIVRRTDGEELLALEAWEVERPWWSEAVVAYPEQNVGARFRQLIHTKVDQEYNIEGTFEEELLPFLPPPPPPQPTKNPTTPKAPGKEKPPKQKPPEKKPDPPSGPSTPPAPGGSAPKTGGG